MSDESNKYAQTGVNYGTLDTFKVLCQKAAAETKLNGGTFFKEPDGIRGESAYILETDEYYLAHVEEGLGTKNLVADEVKKLGNSKVARPYYNIGIDTVASIVNDLITVGALPTVIAMHAAVASGDWFKDAERAKDLAQGFAEGCNQSNAIWGGGETPALKNIICDNSIALAGSAVGLIKPKSQFIKGNLEDGDKIIFLASSGIHANGITLCRNIAEKLPDSYLSKLSDGTTFGDTILAPTTIYTKIISELFKNNIIPKYTVNITGHGWRKLMRLEGNFSYNINKCPEISPLFNFIMEKAELSLREAYATFNMGAGFAIYVSSKDAEVVANIANSLGYNAWIAGEIKQSKKKSVNILEYKISYDGESLKIRA